MRQVYETLSLGVGLLKSNVNLKFRLNVSCKAIHSRRLNGSNNRTVLGSYATLTSNGLLESLFQFTEKTRNGKRGILMSHWSAKTWHKRYSFLMFSTFSIITSLLLNVTVHVYSKVQLSIKFHNLFNNF